MQAITSNSNVKITNRVYNISKKRSKINIIDILNEREQLSQESVILLNNFIYSSDESTDFVEQIPESVEPEIL